MYFSRDDDTKRRKQGGRGFWWKNLKGKAVETFRAIVVERLAALEEGNQEDIDLVKERYKVAKREAKIAVANAKDKAYKDLYEKLDFKEGANDIYKIANAQERRRMDIGNVRYIKDEGGRRAVRSSSPHMHYECYYSRINKGEVKTALKKMGRNKAVYPDQIPIEAWRLSEVIPIHKNKGNTQACSNYRGIKLLSHTMKLWERVIERSLKEKYRERQRDLHMAFLNLEKAYDSVPRELVWKTLIDEGTPRRYSRVIKDMGIQEDIPWCMIFVDDIVLIAESVKGLNNRLESWRKALEDNGLRVSRENMKYLRYDFDRFGEHRSGRIDDDVAHRIRAGWTKWRATSGVLCDWRIPLKLKGKFYKVAIRPYMLYCSECWPIMKAHATRVEVVELRMLRDQNAPVRRVEAMKFEGSWRRGRPKLRWKDRLKMDMKELLIFEDMTSDRNTWRDRIRSSGLFFFDVLYDRTLMLMSSLGDVVFFLMSVVVDLLLYDVVTPVLLMFFFSVESMMSADVDVD
uniref:Reverse transcriptase domain-containing protein n=1 Tax=Tanacetum cinerariifolium TaxID=118510 RepID=A0A6L2JH15_TANCI|nr:hypothetical protein [Tanacetum cinerariifolium]